MVKDDKVNAKTKGTLFLGYNVGTKAGLGINQLGYDWTKSSLAFHTLPTYKSLALPT